MPATGCAPLPTAATRPCAFRAHTPGLRQLVAWLRHGGVTPVALEATGAYGHVLFLTLLEAGFPVITTSPTSTRPIQGRPRIDRRAGQGLQRLHRHGLLPSVFQPDEATQTLRDLVRQRANHVRLSGQHLQRLRKALELMNLKRTQVLGDVTGVTGLKILRAIVAGERDPQRLAKLRDRRCQHTADEIATALESVKGVKGTCLVLHPYGRKTRHVPFGCPPGTSRGEFENRQA